MTNICDLIFVLINLWYEWACSPMSWVWVWCIWIVQISLGKTQNKVIRSNFSAIHGQSIFYILLRIFSSSSSLMDNDIIFSFFVILHIYSISIRFIDGCVRACMWMCLIHEKGLETLNEDLPLALHFLHLLLLLLSGVKAMWKFLMIHGWSTSIFVYVYTLNAFLIGN